MPDKLEDTLNRLRDLVCVGVLAADGMHGLFEAPAASALSAYFELLAEKIEEMKGADPRTLRRQFTKFSCLLIALPKWVPAFAGMTQGRYGNDAGEVRE